MNISIGPCLLTFLHFFYFLFIVNHVETLEIPNDKMKIIYGTAVGVGDRYSTFHQIQSILIQTFILENLIFGKNDFFVNFKNRSWERRRKNVRKVARLI
jgi:hypothetical protein